MSAPYSRVSHLNTGTPERRVPLLPMTISALIGAGLAALALSAVPRSRDASRPPAAPISPIHPTPAVAGVVDHFLAPPALPPDTDPALLNLLCSPSASRADLPAFLRTLDDWAAAIGTETNRNLHRYHQDPDGFGSEAEWRLGMMCTILAQDFKLRYDPALASPGSLASDNSHFFARSAPVFLDGCLSPERVGTCASLPVLHVAIGRRLGYPMHLVAARNHLFARWDDGKGVRINMESANAGGFTSHPDDHYRTWPFPISAQEEKAGGYLRNLDATQALAIFLTTRAVCLQAAGNNQEAARSAAAAYRIAPTLAGTAECLTSTLTQDSRLPGDSRFYYPETRPRIPTPHIPGLPPDPSPYLPPPAIPNPAAPRPVPGQPYRPGYPHAP